MAPFTLASLSETFNVLMNTPLVPVDSSRAPRDVPLTEMPASSRQSREIRRQSNSSSFTTSSQSSESTSVSDRPDERVTSSAQIPMNTILRTPSPVLASYSKELPPLPPGARHQSRVHFADDIDVEL